MFLTYYYDVAFLDIYEIYVCPYYYYALIGHWFAPMARLEDYFLVDLKVSQGLLEKNGKIGLGN